MTRIRISGLFLIASFLVQSCDQKASTIKHESKNLIIEQISEHCYVHRSFLETEKWGKVPCNGMIIIQDGESLVFDTPTKNSTSLELIDWIENGNDIKIKAVVATHFHIDCLGGLEAFHKYGIRSYAHNSTIILAARNSSEIPYEGFKYKKSLTLGSKKVELHYLGEGHTKDNIVAYFSEDQVLFGGCLIKANGAGKGNLDDANVEEWPRSVTSIKNGFPGVKIVIPGHGKVGGPELFDYTIDLISDGLINND